MYIMIMIIIIIIIYTEKAHTVKVNVRCWTGEDTNRLLYNPTGDF